MNKKLDMRYIVRHEKQGNSYHVRFQRVGEVKSFNDAEYGDKKKALAAAVKWRDKMIREHPDWAPGYSNRSAKEWGKARSNNSTGVDSVSLTKRGRDGAILIQASWRDEEQKIKYKTYGIGKKYTLEEAFSKAVQERYCHTGRADEYDADNLDFSKVKEAYERLLNAE